MKLHEMLAVEKTASTAAGKLLSESKKTMSKDSLFRGQTRVLTHFSDDSRNLDTTETQAITTTVKDNLMYLRDAWCKWVNIVGTIDRANQEAVADIVIDGETIVEKVPATTLLGLESKLSEFRKLLDIVPTLAPGINWIPDPSSEIQGVYKTADPISTIKEVREQDFKKITEATEQHPAQVAQVEIAKPVGRYETVSLSGMISPLEKAEILTRLDAMLRAVKQARSRANGVECERQRFSESIFDYILN